MLMADYPKLIAIDVVALPNQQLTEELITLNRQIDCEQLIPLNAKNCLPHISLAMGAIKGEDIPKVYQAISLLANAMSPFKFELDDVYTMELTDGRTSVGINLKQTNELLQLHEHLMEIIAPFNQKATSQSISPIRGTNPLTLNYIDSFREEHSYKKYQPHITLGFGKLESLGNIALNSTIEDLFICQLANYCTCARILESFPLKT